MSKKLKKFFKILKKYWMFNIFHKYNDGVRIINPLFILELGFVPCWNRDIFQEKFTLGLFPKLWNIQLGEEIKFIFFYTVIFSEISMQEIHMRKIHAS